jgi:uncharacterized membrane protein (TIGR02234 family)
MSERAREPASTGAQPAGGAAGHPAAGHSAGGHSARREYGLALLAGAAGAAIILLAVRQRWAQAVFTPPKPLTPQVVNVSGADLVPLAGALALAALAGLAAVFATRGALRRAAGVLVALFGAGAGAAIMTSVSAATVINVAASKVASPESAAISGAAGSTTSGRAGGGALVVSGSTAQAFITGTPWHAAVLIGALLVFVAGLATVLRGPDWPVMSARYDAPGARAAGAKPDAPAGQARRGRPGRPGGPGGQARPLDAATMWESLSGGADPTEDDQAENTPPPAHPAR